MNLEKLKELLEKDALEKKTVELKELAGYRETITNELRAYREFLVAELKSVEKQIGKSGLPQKRRKARQGGRLKLSNRVFPPVGTTIKARYKGQEYEAVIRERNMIEFNGNLYGTPTAAATVVYEGRAVNGWSFWRVFDENSKKWKPMSEACRIRD